MLALLALFALAPQSSQPSAPRPSGRPPISPGQPGGRPGIGPRPSGPTAPPVGPGPTAPAPGPRPLLGIDTGPNYELWTHWWDSNRDRFLELKSHVARQDGVVTLPSDGDAGVRASLLPTASELRRDVLPVLDRILRESDDRDLLMASLRALAEIRDQPSETAAKILPFVGHSDGTVGDAALLALGILGAPEGLPPLAAIFEGGEAGKAARGQQSLACPQRSLAAHALGLLGSRTSDEEVTERVRAVLLRSLDVDGMRCWEIQAAAVVALGNLPDPTRSTVRRLEKFLTENRRSRDAVAAHVPPAIAKILRDAPQAERRVRAQEMLRELTSREHGNARFLRGSFAIAMGLLVRAEDRDAGKLVDGLEEAAERLTGRNAEAAGFSWIALGEIVATGRPGSPGESALLERAVHQGGRVSTRMWAALALGVAGHGQRRRGELGAPDPVAKALRTRMMTLKDPLQRAAFSIALALRGDQESGPLILRAMDEVNDEAVRGYFAQALGLLGHREAIAAVQALFESAERKPELLQEAAIALALLGDKKAEERLLRPRRDGSAPVVGVWKAYAAALGKIGDYRVLPALLSAARGEAGFDDSISRATAIRAIGRIGDADPLPWNERLAAHFNYVASEEPLPK